MPVTITVTPFDSYCSNEPQNDSDLTLNVDIKNKGNGEDAEWLPLDVIEIVVEFENDINDADLNDVVFELGLFETGSTSNIAEDMIWISEDENEVEVGDVDEGDKGSHTFEFRIDPAEVESGSYVLIIKAYPDGDETEMCIDYSSDLTDGDFGDSVYYAEIDITKEGDDGKMVIVDVDALPTPLEAFCGQQVTLTTPIYNIGDQDFEDQIKATLNSAELGVNLEEVIVGDLDSGDSTEATFVFNIPSNAKEQQYILKMATFYDYDEEDDKYKEQSDSTFDTHLKVEGNCISDSTVSIAAVLESGGKAGSELTVKSTITNTGSKTQNYTLTASGYTDWASSAVLDSTIVTLKAGESKDVLITLDVKKDAEGEKLFNIDAVGENEDLLTQTVSVAIEKAGFSLPGLTGEAIFDNKLLIFGLFNIILILAIIIVVVKLMKSKR